MNIMESDLVSVVIICYNAETYIIEALNSVKRQTYKNIELVVSDDCSTDNTLSVCKKWAAKNNDRFTNINIVKTQKNSGVTINCDLGTRTATGKWIKLLAGDDILPENTISKCIDYIAAHDIDTILCTKAASFIEKNGKIRITGYKPEPYIIKVFNLPASKQYQRMLHEYVMPTSMMIKKDLLKKIGYYDVTFPDIDDFPLWLKITSSGIKINHCDEILGYMHRTNISSISQTVNGIMNVAAFKIGGKQHRQDIKYVLPNIPKYHIIFYYHFYLDLFRRYIVIEKLKNKDTYFNRFVNKALLAIDPIFMKKKIYNFMHPRRNEINVER